MSDAKTEVTAPVVGTEAEWGDPRRDSYIDNLIKRYGQGPFTVSFVRDRPLLPGKNRWSVTIKKDGQPVYSSWDYAIGPMPGDFEPTICELSWKYLEPVS
jgi:hypothetical protein